MIQSYTRALLSLILLCPSLSFAQDATAEKVERIEVTGSHIKRVDVEGVAPVETVTKKDIEKKGYDSLGDVVRDLGVASFGSSPGGGFSDVDLRGLGSDNTLVLLNGQRLPQDAVTGTVDINLIPLAAVERIEILKDGASAIYGSDALGGVLNVITIKDFDGTQLNATQSIPTNFAGGKQTNISVVNGLNFEKLNVVTSVNYLYNQPVFSADRPWLGLANSIYGSPGSYLDSSGIRHASSNCPAGNIVHTGTHGATYCAFHFPAYSEEASSVSQLGAMTEFHYEASSTLRYYGRLNYIYRYQGSIAAPAPGVFTIPAGSPGIIASQANGAPAYTSGDLNIYARTLALGPRMSDYTTNAYGGVLGAIIQLPKDWQAETTANVNYVHYDSNAVNGFSKICSTGAPDPNTGLCTGTPGTTGIADLVTSGTYKPLAPNGQQGNVSTAAYQPWSISDTLLTLVEFKTSGDVLELPAGPLGLAMGTSVAFTQYHNNSDPETVGIAGQTNVFGSAGSNGAGHRTQEAVYSEFSVPVITKTLEFQMAARYDHFSDFGSTFNPKFGFLYHATSDLLFRGSVGTGFRAPLLTELYAGPSNSAQTFTDFAGCQSHPGDSSFCTAKQYTVNGGSNPNLKQETSVSYNLGTVYEPIKDLNFGLDFFYNKINNIPGIDYDDMERAEAAGVNLAALGVSVVRDSSGQIQYVNAPLLNLQSLQEAGIDLTAAYTVDQWKFGSEQNQLFFYKTSGFPGLPIKDKLGWDGLPRWRNTTTTGYSFNDRNNLTGYVRTIPGQMTEDQKGTIRSLTTLDLAYTLRTEVYGTFSLTVVNVFNTPPPTDASTPTLPVNYALYDMNGRQVILGYKRKL